ncbi:MAG: DUF4404 family protein [Anaerolineae bacterium]|nr:DUF4404 family protein [Anaerolineae bacterium]
MDNKSLQALQDQLERIETDNEATQAEAEALREHIQDVIEAKQSRETLLGRLEQVLIHFEDDHPDIAAALRTVIDTLSGAGI